MDSIAHSLRKLARRIGLDVQRYPEGEFGYKRSQLLARQRVDVVLDVGANCGQWASDVRRWGFRGRIESFEPGTDAYSALAAKATGASTWRTHRCALGDEIRDVELHLAANGGASSSVLPMLQSHISAAPGARYVGAEIVPQTTLATVWTTLIRDGEAVYLKADVQGFERQVLDGMGDHMAAVVGAELELSFVELYEGGMLFAEAVTRMSDAGFSLLDLQPNFRDPASGVLLSADGLFVRTTDARLP